VPCLLLGKGSMRSTQHIENDFLSWVVCVPVGWPWERHFCCNSQFADFYLWGWRRKVLDSKVLSISNIYFIFCNLVFILRCVIRPLRLSLFWVSIVYLGNCYMELHVKPSRMFRKLPQVSALLSGCEFKLFVEIIVILKGNSSEHEVISILYFLPL
jgi:hypothetical protein